MKSLNNLKNSDKYQKILRKKEDFAKKLRGFFFETLGFDRLRVPLMILMLDAEWLCVNAFYIIVNGLFIFVAVIGSSSDVPAFKILGFGTALYVITRLLSKLWKQYVIYRFRLNKVNVVDRTESEYQVFRKDYLSKRGIREDKR